MAPVSASVVVLVVHVAVPDAGNAAGGYHAQAFLPGGINWPDRRAQAEEEARVAAEDAADDSTGG